MVCEHSILLSYLCLTQGDHTRDTGSKAAAGNELDHEHPRHHERALTLLPDDLPSKAKELSLAGPAKHQLEHDEGLHRPTQQLGGAAPAPDDVSGPGAIKRQKMTLSGSSSGNNNTDGPAMTAQAAANETFTNFVGVTNSGAPSGSWGAQVAELVWKRFHSVHPKAALSPRKRHIVSGVVLVDNRPDGGASSAAQQVVALGSGSTILRGDQLSLEGQRVQDCHAEVVARRSLLRWLYSQIEAAAADAGGPPTQPAGSSAAAGPSPSQLEGGAVVPSPVGSTRPYRLRQGLELWLYISCAPCGDAALFSRADQQSAESGNGKGGKRSHTESKMGGHRSLWPHMNNVSHLRCKLELGQGTFPVPAGEEQEPGMDGVNRGQRVRRHSCSDKIAKWSAVGLQGALLSRLLEPVYLQGVVVGELFSGPHLHRALCCRSHRALSRPPCSSSSTVPPAAATGLPVPFRLHHLRALPAQTSDTRRHEAVVTAKKMPSESANWAEGDPNDAAELIEAASGSLVLHAPPHPTAVAGPHRCCFSRISKASLFARFCHLVPGADAVSYAENKHHQGAEAYQAAKQAWKEAMREAGFGCWLQRPPDYDQFLLGC